MSDTYDIIQRQKKEVNIYHREKEAEERYLPVLEMTFKETCVSEIGKKQSLSIAQQINNWIKSLSAKQKRNKLFFIEIDSSIKEFRNYVLEKYKNNKKQLSRFEALFSQQDYLIDCKRILLHKIYDYKTSKSIEDPESGFLSATAYRSAMTNRFERNIRNMVHEALGSTYKNIDGPELTEETERMMINTFTKTIKKWLDEFMEAQKQNLLNERKRNDELLE